MEFNLEDFSDSELIELVEESNQQFIGIDAKIHVVAKTMFGNDSVIDILGVQATIAPILAKRLKAKNELINELNDETKNKHINNFVKLYGSSEEAKNCANSFAVGFTKAWEIIVGMLNKK